MKKSVLVSNLFAYSLGHLFVDLACAFLIFSFIKGDLNLTNLFLFILIYNFLAFGFQVPFGALIDRIRKPKEFSIIGLIFILLAFLLFYFSSLAAIILAGLGNALFHIGGGVISLNLIPKKATIPGIFVAPGALGLTLGIFLAKLNYSSILFYLFLIGVLLIFGIGYLRNPKLILYGDKKKIKISFFEIILLFILFSIVIRSIVGLALVFPWKTNTIFLIIFTLSVVLGKALGGFLADKFGWKAVAVWSLALSAPFLFFGADYVSLGIIGIFLFNITMPITLTMLSNIMPRRPGFAFGLNCLALLIGAIICFTPLKNSLGIPWVVLLTILLSVVLVYFSLVFYNKNNNF